MTKELNYYMSLPWIFEFEPCPEGGYYARVSGISCYSHGDDICQASENIKEALACYIESCINDGDLVPEPLQDENFSGQLNVRVSKSLHKRLTLLAKKEGVSVSHLINDALVKNYFSKAG